MHNSAMQTMVAAIVAPSEFHLAPMQCYTNQPLRKFAGVISPSSVRWTEMEKVDDLVPDIATALEKRLLGGEEDEDKLVLQLGSNDVDKLDKCVRVATQNFPNLREVNLNCGCPAIDVGGASTYGASLMKDTHLTAQLVQSMCSASENVDISVKCRIAVFDNDIPAQLTENDYQYLSNYVSAIHDAGAKHIVLHARPAILSLSPVKNRNIPTLDYEFVNRIASDFNGKLKITLNGGIKSIQHLRDIRTDSSAISSYMAGRWCLHRPLDLILIEKMHGGKEVNPRTAIDRYIDYASRSQTQSRFTMADICLPLYLVVEQLREDYGQEEEGELLSWEDMENLYDDIQDGLHQLGGGKLKTSNSINFKKLSSSFKNLVGTKIVNKWKRNRSEL